MKNIIVFMTMVFMLSSCLTGGFNENEQLSRHESELAKAPKIVSLKVDGEVIERNTQSIRVVEAKMGENISIDATLLSGSGAELEELEFFRIYYYHADPEDPLPVEVGTTGIYSLSGQEHQFTFSYEVPVEDDDGYSFLPGDTIQIYLRVKNSLDNFGYISFEIYLIE